MTSGKIISQILCVSLIYCGTAFADNKAKIISPSPIYINKPDHIPQPCEKAPYWRTDGNCGTDPGFLGTSSDAPLIFKTKDEERMRVRQTGETMVRSLLIGYGDQSPSIHFFNPSTKTYSAALGITATGVLSVDGDLTFASNSGIVFPDGKVTTRSELVGEKGRLGDPGRPGDPGLPGKDGAGIASATYSNGFLVFTLTNGNMLPPVAVRPQCQCRWGAYQSISGGGNTSCSATAGGAGSGPADNIEQCTRSAFNASGSACDISCD